MLKTIITCFLASVLALSFYWIVIDPIVKSEKPEKQIIKKIEENKENQAMSVAPSISDGRKLVCRIYEKHMAIVERKGPDGKESPGLLGGEQAEWLSKLDFSRFRAQQRQDLESWRNALQVLDKFTGSEFSRGMKSFDASKNAMAVLADFEVNDQVAITTGFSNVAGSIDNLLTMAKGIVLVKEEQDAGSLKRVRAPVKFFVEYFYIFNILAGARERNPIVQAALLSMHPNQVQVSTERQQLLQLHEAILAFSRAHPIKGDALKDNRLLEAIYAMLTAMNNLNITDGELAQAGGDKLVQRMTSFRKWRKQLK